MMGPRPAIPHEQAAPLNCPIKLETTNTCSRESWSYSYQPPPTVISTHKQAPFHIEVKAFKVVSLGNSTFTLVILSFLKFIKQLDLDT